MYVFMLATRCTIPNGDLITQQYLCVCLLQAVDHMCAKAKR